MVRKKSMSIFDKELCNRIFLIFSAFNDTETAEKVGTTRQTIQGWRSGRSRPTLDQIKSICERMDIDWEWLMTGKSPNVDTIINAYFPSEKTGIPLARPDLYNDMRTELLGSGHIFSCREDDSFLEDLIYAIGVVWQGSVDLNAPDPSPIVNENWLHTPFNTWVSRFRQFNLSEDSFAKTQSRIRQMRNDFIRPERMNYKSVSLPDETSMEQIKELYCILREMQNQMDGYFLKVITGDVEYKRFAFYLKEVANAMKEGAEQITHEASVDAS